MNKKWHDDQLVSRSELEGHSHDLFHCEVACACVYTYVDINSVLFVTKSKQYEAFANRPHQKAIIVSLA